MRIRSFSLCRVLPCQPDFLYFAAASREHLPSFQSVQARRQLPSVYPIDRGIYIYIFSELWVRIKNGKLETEWQRKTRQPSNPYCWWENNPNLQISISAGQTSIRLLILYIYLPFGLVQILCALQALDTRGRVHQLDPPPLHPPRF